MPQRALRVIVLLLLPSGFVSGCAPAPRPLPSNAPAGSRTQAWRRAPSVRAPSNDHVVWSGQQGPQEASPLIPSARLITAATHPLATLDLPNPSANPVTFTIDLFIADQAASTGRAQGFRARTGPG